jgi:hypothetical protein
MWSGPWATDTRSVHGLRTVEGARCETWNRTGVTGRPSTHGALDLLRSRSRFGIRNRPDPADVRASGRRCFPGRHWSVFVHGRDAVGVGVEGLFYGEARVDLPAPRGGRPGNTTGSATGELGQK